MELSGEGLALDDFGMSRRSLVLFPEIEKVV